MIDIRQRLRFHPLRGIDHQQRALTRRQRTRHFVGEVDVTGGIHQIEMIGFAVLGGVGQSHRLGFNGNATFPLDIH